MTVQPESCRIVQSAFALGGGTPPVVVVMLASVYADVAAEAML
jgi:hypothetical protein